jgi:hypothetical protein
MLYTIALISATLHLLYKFINYLIIPSAQYFVLHAIFNLWVMCITLPDVIFTFTSHKSLSENPESYNNAAITSTFGIIIFHLHHIMTSWSSLSQSDKIHHTVSVMIMSLFSIQILNQFQRIIACSNFFMCGLPGYIDYCLLTLVKYDKIQKHTEKRINCFLNLLIRLPGQWACSLIGVIYTHNLCAMSYWQICNMWTCILLHMCNAVYYADLVVGNYYINYPK